LLLSQPFGFPDSINQNAASIGQKSSGVKELISSKHSEKIIETKCTSKDFQEGHQVSIFQKSPLKKLIFFELKLLFFFLNSFDIFS